MDVASIHSIPGEEDDIAIGEKPKKRSSKVEALTEEQIAEYKEVFELFDKDADGIVASSQVRMMLKALAIWPNDQELASLTEKADPDETGQMDFDSFLEMVVVATKENVFTELEMKECFRVFDPEEKNWIWDEELQEILTEMGDSFTEDEVAQFLREADYQKDGKINYVDFIMLAMLS